MGGFFHWFLLFALWMAFNRSKWNTFFCFDIKTVSSSKKSINFLVFNFFFLPRFSLLLHFLTFCTLTFYFSIYFSISILNLSILLALFLTITSVFHFYYVSLSFYWFIFYLSFRFLPCFLNNFICLFVTLRFSQFCLCHSSLVARKLKILGFEAREGCTASI